MPKHFFTLQGSPLSQWKICQNVSGYIIFNDMLVSYLLQYSMLMYTQLEPN